MFTLHSTKQEPSRRLARQTGLTLIELMIAMVIGVFLLIGTLTVFTQSRANFRVADSIARLQENARFAMDLVEPDLRLARFWGRNAEPGAIPGPTDATFPAGIVVTCDTNDRTVAPATYTTWSLNILAEIRAVDETSGYAHAQLGIPCDPSSGAGGAQIDSDALIVRIATVPRLISLITSRIPISIGSGISP